MYLLSQNKKTLIKFEKIEITSLFKNHTIMAYGAGQSIYAEVGTYDSEEKAQAELGHIMSALNNDQMIYEVR